MSTTTQTDGGTPNTQQTTGGTPSTTANQSATPEPPATFDAWLQKQDEHGRKLFDEHVSGLKNALKSERTEKGDLDKKLKELIKQAADVPALKAQLEQLAADNEKKGKRADFLEQAATAGISDLKLAWIAVSGSEEFTDRKGNIDFEALKKAHPSLFESKARIPDVNAGRGIGGGLPKTNPNAAMNDFIRKAAGTF